MNIKIAKFIKSGVIVVLFLNLFAGYSAFSEATGEQPDDNGYNSIYKMMYVMQKIRRDYVDEKKVGYSALIRGAMRGMLRNLDPFCSYMDEQGYKDMIEDTEGREYGGVGIVVTYKSNALRVIAPADDSPASRAGIQPGDIILKIDDHETSSMSFDECVKKMKGEVGTSITLTIYRESDDSTVELTIKREMIELSTVKGAKIVQDGVGYVRITQFNLPTAADLDKALKKLKDEEMKALVLDLRGNPGGLLTSAIEVSSRFVDTGELIVYTEGRMKSSRFDYFSLKCDKFTGLPLAILVDGNSASASEIVAGCLQDHKKAVLVGEKTFGKGSVQTVFPMPDNSGAIRLTTAKYYTPSNRVIHENGIEPTVAVLLSQKELGDIYSQRLAFPGIIKPNTPDSVTDVQLQRAVEVLKGVCLFENTVYGE